jgi:hypothetical protein
VLLCNKDKTSNGKRTKVRQTKLLTNPGSNTSNTHKVNLTKEYEKKKTLTTEYNRKRNRRVKV